MFAGLVLLRPGFRGTAKRWWTASLVIQGWHLIEHSTLQLQAIAGQNLFGSPVPTSFLQLFVPRPELHLLYNLIVFVPMVVAMWLHTRPDQAAVNECTCADAPVRVGAGGSDRGLTGTGRGRGSKYPSERRVRSGSVYTSPMVGRVRSRTPMHAAA